MFLKKKWLKIFELEKKCVCQKFDQKASQISSEAGMVTDSRTCRKSQVASRKSDRSAPHWPFTGPSASPARWPALAYSAVLRAESASPAHKQATDIRSPSVASTTANAPAPRYCNHRCSIATAAFGSFNHPGPSDLSAAPIPDLRCASWHKPNKNNSTHHVPILLALLLLRSK